MKSYPSYKDSRVVSIGKLPDEWQCLRIKRIVSTRITDGPHETPELTDEGIPFLSAESVRNGRLNFNNKRGFISKSDHERFSKKCKPQYGDVFLIKSGATTGEAAFNDVNTEFSIWSPLALIRANEERVLGKFVYYFVSSIALRRQVELGWNYGTQQNIGMGVIENLFISFPNINDQEIIMKYLDDKTSMINSLIDDKERMVKLLEEKRQAIITEAVTKGLNPDVKMKDSGVEWIGEIPEHWNIVKLKYCLKDGSLGVKIGPFGSSLKLDTMVNEGYKVYGQENLIKRDFDIGKRYITKEKFEELSVYEINTGDVLISMMGTIGKCMVVPSNIKKGVMDSHLIRLSFKEDVVFPEFISLLIGSSNYVEEQFKISSKGSIMSGLNSTIIKSLNIILPPITEQQKILAFLNKKLNELDNLKSSLVIQIEKLKEYRQSLIYEAVTGKIDVRNYKGKEV
jgi:type I restriction enzyme, S subunit